MQDNTNFPIQYVSDIHLEFSKNNKYMQENPIVVKSEILVIAGDCIVLNSDFQYHPFFRWCSANYKQTFIVFGNHEFYGGYEVSQTLKPFEIFIHQNVRYINNKTVVIGDTELFFTTLWSELIDNYKPGIKMQLNDFHLIKYNGHTLTTDDYDYMFKCCSEWLGDALSKSNAKRKIVVTHHCPTLKLVEQQFLNSPMNCCFNVDMEDMMVKENVNAWIYGHTHSNFEPLKISNTTILSNQLGYVMPTISDGYKNNKYYPDESSSCSLV
ncbi:metallophosphoesterase [Entamoeba marina]